MINLSFDELRLIAQVRNISGYENKSKEDFIKALSEPKSEAPKPEIPKPEIRKPKTPKLISSKLKISKSKIPKPKPRPEIRVNEKKLKTLRKDFDELRHKFDKKEKDRYRKAFYDVKSYESLSISKIKKASKSLNKLKKSLRFKTFRGNIDSVNYEDIDNYDYNYDFADDDEYRKIGSIRKLFKELDRDYYKPIRTDVGFAGRNDNYIEYTSKADKYENLLPKEYLNVIRPYLRNLINDHETIIELNNNNDTNATTNIDRAEMKIQLIITNNFISVKDFEDTRTICPASTPVEIFMGSDTENIIDTLFNTILDKIQQAMETSNERGSGFTHDSVGLSYYHFQRINIRRGGSYITSPDWMVNKKATINPKNEKDNESFK